MIDVVEKNKPLAGKVYDELLRRILKGRWRPGSFFDRRSVANELGVSIAPVGEAMIRLEEDGFIVTIPRKGTMLRACDPRNLYENLILREAIECQAVSMSFKKLALPNKALSQLAERTDAAAPSERSAADAEFHKKLTALAGVDALTAQLARLRLQLMFDEILFMENNAPVADSHNLLLKDLAKSTTPETAAARMRMHLRCGRESFFTRFEKEKGK